MLDDWADFFVSIQTKSIQQEKYDE